MKLLPEHLQGYYLRHYRPGMSNQAHLTDFEDHPFMLGHYARKNGGTLVDNPYPALSDDHLDWEAGFNWPPNEDPRDFPTEAHNDLQDWLYWNDYEDLAEARIHQNRQDF